MFARSSNWLKLAPLPPLHDNDDDDDGNNGDDDDDDDDGNNDDDDGEVSDFCHDKDCCQLLYKIGSSWLHSLLFMTMMIMMMVIMVMMLEIFAMIKIVFSFSIRLDLAGYTPSSP